MSADWWQLQEQQMGADWWQMQEQLEREQWEAEEAGRVEYESWLNVLDAQPDERLAA